MLALLLGACDRPASEATGDTAVAVTIEPRAETLPSVRVPSGWDAGAGAYVVLPTVDGGMSAASLVLPEATDSTVGDTTGLTGALGDGQVELFARSGRVAVARVSVDATPPREAGCTAWPVARLAVDTGQILVPWTAAFPVGRVQAVALDSIEGLAPRDSAGLAADLTRLASRLPDDTSATFRGLPFVVLRAWRTAGLEETLVVAVLARRVNQEDNPLEERVVLVAEAPTRKLPSWRVGWHERASGQEDELVVAEPLLAFRVSGANDLRVLFGRDDGHSLGAAILARREGGWRVLWESAIAGCG
jgi:hypothetical protein